MSQHAELECPGKDGDEWVLCRHDNQGKRRTVAHVYTEEFKDKIVRAVNAHADLLAALKEAHELLRSLVAEEMISATETQRVGACQANMWDAIAKAEGK